MAAKKRPAKKKPAKKPKVDWLDVAVPMIARFEGFRSRTYLDAVGVRTIGYGETLGRYVNRGYISRADARKLLRRRVAAFGRDVERLVRVPLTPRQKAALVCFAYNVGIGAFGSSTLLREVNRRHFSRVPRELMRWTRGGGRVLPGLVTRRRREAAVWRRGTRGI